MAVTAAATETPSQRRRRWFDEAESESQEQQQHRYHASNGDQQRREAAVGAATVAAGRSVVAVTAGLASMCAVGARRLSSLSTAAGGVSQAGEVVSEAVCWGLMAAVVGVVNSKVRADDDDDDDGKELESGMGMLEAGDGSESFSSGGKGRGVVGKGTSASSWSLWAVAAGIVVACCYVAEIGEITLYPLLTPLLLVAEKKLRPEVVQRPGSGLATLANTVKGAVLVAAVAMLALVNWSLLELALPIIPGVALLVVYFALIPRTASDPRFFPLIPEVEKAIRPLSIRIIVFLLGVLGAIHTSLHAATSIGTFGLVASRDPSIQFSELGADLAVFASLIVLAQLILMIPKQVKGRLVLWALFLVSAGPYLANTAAIKRAQSAALHSREHPAEVLIHNAKADFDRLLERQSKTHSAAVEEYRRRYGVEPPPGFKEWYEFAVENQSPIIDEFDMIFESVSPFWSLSGKDVVQIMDNAHSTPGIDLWLCSFSGSNAETSCSHPARRFDRHIGDLFNTLLGDLPGVLPDAKFLVNHLDEPRVLIPPGPDSQEKPFTLTSLSGSPTWDAITKFCASQPDMNQPTLPLDTLGLPLVINITAALDLCAHPEYADIHGLFQAPNSFRLIEGLVPVLSTGAPSTMSDILFPSPAYVVEPEFRYNPSHDMPWSKKTNHLYWAGSTTGAVATPDNDWRRFHRQRFVALAQSLDPGQQHTYIREITPSSSTENGKNAEIAPTRSGFLNARLYKVFPTRIFQCRPPYLCRRQRAHFRPQPWQDADAAMGAKLVFDLDGNGISGRFGKLLASRSCVLKQTVLREWWHGSGGQESRLVPWVHYVPVSMDMGELSELVSWLLNTQRGREAAREIGEAGAEWALRAMRDVDVKVYLWRLVLELARVGDVARGPLKG
ncbi:glycosyltransferase [Corynascus novoguineensis]|uniref:Glycosyltransferase n=1 Tax=Corynascus novoguineensis TaxID=1126955 RepID=A0AAN7HQX6_9PEZI|nr:glycosyltransferase [Corynascus novoguineensis]